MLLIISIISFFGYVGYITYKFGILPSISDSFYKTDKDWFFLLFTFGTGIPITFYSPFVLMQIAGVLLTYVGLSPRFKSDNNSIEDEIHGIAAIASIFCALLSLVVNYGLWYIPIPVILMSLNSLKMKKNGVFWIEVVAFISILTGLIIG